MNPRFLKMRFEYLSDSYLPKAIDPHGTIYFKVNHFRNNKHTIRLLVSISMTVEQPAFEIFRSVSELQTFAAHFKLQYLYICFIYCFIITDISGYISINRITNFEHVIDIINKNY